MGTIEMKKLKDKIPAPWFELHRQRSKILEKYTYTKLDQKIVLLKVTELIPLLKPIQDESNYWAKFSTKPVNVYLLPGDHDSVFYSPNVELMSKILDDFL